MKTFLASPRQPMLLTLLIFCTLSAFVMAQDNNSQMQVQQPDRARFVVISPKPAAPGTPEPVATLEEWNGSFMDHNGNKYPFVMVGADPSTNQGALITTYIIPLKIVLSTGEIYDPLSGGPFGPLARTVLSPVFDKSTNYTQGGVDVGTTQYIDAYQRANFWKIVQNNPNSHLLLGGPSATIGVLPEQTLNVPAQYGKTGNKFGHPVGLVDITYLDGQLAIIMNSLSQINPSVLPIFMTTDLYLTQGSGFRCCIGGYHGANGAQTYMHFSYITFPGAFSQDVSALTHEVGEWADDPLYPQQNSTPCGSLENGDPLVHTNNYGSYPYLLHGFTYNLQDLVFLRYFDAPADTSVNNWWSFQGYPFTQICQNGS